jgi:limonene-1,2-epoxide hydrolase
MGESAAEKIVSAYLDALEDRDFERLRSFLSDTRFSYRSPVSRTDDADTFILIISRVGPILERIERTRTFVDGNDVCSILKFRTTMEAIREIPVVQLTTVAESKIIAMELFFDASEYNRMFDFES